MKLLLCIALFLAVVSCVPVAPKAPKTDCDICQTLIGAIEDWMENNKTETQIIDDFETLCYLVPLWTDVCDQIVVYGVDKVIAYIENDQPPSVVCGEIGICAAKKMVVHKAKPKPKARDENCFLCETVIETVEDWVENNASIAEIEQNLEALCALVPGLQAQCDAIVEQGVPQIVAWIQKNESPTQVCEQLGFCNTTLKFKFHKNPVKLNKALFRSKAKNPKDLECTICEGIISAIEGWVESNQTVQQIIQNLDQLCDLLGDPPQCTAIIAMGVNTIVQMLEKDETPQQVCQQLSYCTSPKPVFKNVMKPKAHVSLA